MLKFLLYLFAFYFVSRFLFGKLFGTTVRTKVYHRDTHHHHHEAGNREEGSITIDPGPGTAGRKQDDKHIGEYVDYEDIKE